MSVYSDQEHLALGQVGGAPAAGHAEASGEGWPMRHVLIATIDDEAMMTDVIQTYLEDAGYARTLAINDPRQALALLREQRPGLVLLDLVMPEVSGFDILAELRRDEALRYVPVIVLTAASDPRTKLRALELGATEFLAKPVDASELVLRVRNSLVFKVYQDRLANLDLLTGLCNRRVFVERLRALLAPEGAHLALLHMGLDRFRVINDSLGQAVGDRILSELAARLQGSLRDGDGAWYAGAERPLLSRLGADEFGLILPELPGSGLAERMAQRLLDAASEPFRVAGHEVYVTLSIGVAWSPADGRDDDALRRAAELAMAQAKADGRNTYRFHTAACRQASSDRLNLENRLRTALGNRELQLYYQPKVHLASGRIVGAEALLRWIHPELGFVPPNEFIPLAEECGLIAEIGRWVLHQACHDLAAWRQAHPDLVEPLSLAVNVARHQVMAGDLVRQVGEALAQHGVPADRLVLELTEGMLMDPKPTVQQQFATLRAQGVRLSIDDFGTGYSSMNYLKRFPLDELKIDKSFVDGIPGASTNLAIVRAMVVLAHSLGMRVVAEGVEEADQREVLRELGCDKFQGYLCSRPVPGPAFLALLHGP